MDSKKLEAVILLILLFAVFRIELVTNKLLIAAVGFLTGIFLLLSFFNFIKDSNLTRLRFLIFLAITVLVYGFLLTNSILKRNANPAFAGIHDGAVQIEDSAKALISGQNPYSTSYFNLLGRSQYFIRGENPEISHYVYSPLTFLVNAPIFALSSALFGIIDLRISLVIFYLLAALASLKIVKERMLFLIIFLFNPVFISSVLYGANDVILIFFLFATIAFLYFKRITLSTIILALATATKLIAVPFVPLYFLYLFHSLKNGTGKLAKIGKQLMIFILVNLAIYLPFAVWNFADLVEDLILYPLRGGGKGYPIGGYFGVPQILHSMRLISDQSEFPFFIPMLFFGILFIFIANFVFKKFANLNTLIILFIIYFILIFSFSRLFQTYYFAFLSQFVILAAFLVDSQKTA